MTSDTHPTPLRQSLEHLLAGLGAPQIEAVNTLIDRWQEVVGPELATQVRAVAVSGSELIVQVEDPAWASQISWLEAQLLERIASLIGAGQITAVTARVARRSRFVGGT